MTEIRAQAMTRMLAGGCGVPGCATDARGAGICAKHWTYATAEERAAAKMASQSPFWPKGQGDAVWTLELRLSVLETAIAIGDRQPAYLRQQRIAA